MADELDFPAGETLIEEGEREPVFLVLVEGTAEVSRNGRKLATLGRADRIGQIAPVLDVPRTSAVTTTSPVRALVLPPNSRSLLEKVSSDTTQDHPISG